MPKLESELAYFAENVEAWAQQYSGRFVVVKNRQLLGTLQRSKRLLLLARASTASPTFSSGNSVALQKPFPCLPSRSGS